MSTKKAVVISLILIILTTVVGRQLPGELVSHWNAQGQPDGYSSKNFALFFLPGMELGLVILLFGLPLIDPRRSNIEKFRPIYNSFVVLVIAFMSYIQALTLAWNLGMKFDLLRLIVPAFAVLIFFTGTLIEKAEPNWFIGIRTPWTLSDNRVWERIHRLGGRAFKWCGLISIAGMLYPPVTFWLLIIPLLVASFGLVVYSYIYYKSINRELR